MKLPVKVRVSSKKIAFFFFSIAWFRPPENMGGRKRVRSASDKTDIYAKLFGKRFGPLSPINFPVEGEVANREGSQIYQLTYHCR